MLLSFIDNPPIPIGSNVIYVHEPPDGSIRFIEGVVAFYDTEFTEVLDVVVLFPLTVDGLDDFDIINQSHINFFINKTPSEDVPRMRALLEDARDYHYTWATSRRLLKETEPKLLNEIVNNLENEISSNSSRS